MRLNKERRGHMEELFETYATEDIVELLGCPAGTCCSWVVAAFKAD